MIFYIIFYVNRVKLLSVKSSHVESQIVMNIDTEKNVKKEFCIDPLMAICSRNICVFIIIIIVVLYMHVHDNTKLKCTKWTDITLCNLKFVPIFAKFWW